jgi:hypothetical protein
MSHSVARSCKVEVIAQIQQSRQAAETFFAFRDSTSESKPSPEPELLRTGLMGYWVEAHVSRCVKWV